MYKIILTSSVSNRYVNKLLLIMRLTIVIILATLMQVSANGYGQRITLKAKGEPLNKVIKEIRKQSGYDFLYDLELIRKTKPVTINVTNEPIEETLEKLFIDQPVTYKLENRAVLLKPKRISIPDRIAAIFTAIDVRGRVIDEKGDPLAGATVNLKSTAKTVITDSDGRFVMKNVSENAILVITFLGFEPREIKAAVNLGNIQMTSTAGKLEEVTVSTGYQTLPKERATGSFEKINDQLFNRITSTDVLSRLNGTVPGLFYNNSNSLDAITIRGISSLTTTQPLVVLDNIPYDGDINNINPNDVLDVTILKDAAAASIWGTRAGNGVIVITTKNGKYEKAPEISFNTNYTVSEKPDLFYKPQISSSDFIDVEKFLFNNGWYDDKLSTTSPFVPFVSPVVDLLAKQRSLPFTDLQGRAQFDTQIDALRNYDVRSYYLKYIYRPQRNQQYALNLNGGGKDISYFVSSGYDKNLNNIVTSDFNRLNLRSNLNLRPIKNLEVQTGILYTKAKSHNIGNQSLLGYNQGQLSGVYPYARFADDQGSPLAIGTIYGTDYLNTLSANPKLMDWRYKPLDDLGKSKSIDNSQDILFNVGTSYSFNSVLSAEVKYQYQRTNFRNEEIYEADSYFTRDLINTYTSPANYEEVTTYQGQTIRVPKPYLRAIPPGGIYNSGNNISTNQTIRAQINADKTWNDKHRLVGLVGAEIRKAYGLSDAGGYRYGYDTQLHNYQTVNYQNAQFPLYYGGVGSIPWGSSLDDSDNRFTSYFANGSYTYDNRYIFSASARKDASNVFGVNSNKKGTPLWSAGAAWDISKEAFYKSEILPYLKLRATYGYSGTTVTGIPAFSVITHGINSTTLYPYVRSANLPNPDLRWEKSGMFNLGLDFRLKNSRLAGSLEYFNKKSTDLLARSPIDLTTGFAEQTFNTANLKGKGIDINLTSLNFRSKEFAWNTNLTFSYNKIVVTKYLLKPTTDNAYVTKGSGSVNPIVGEDAYVLYAYRSAGLDPETGDPRGYINGQISKDYRGIFNSGLANFENMGSTRPRFYGSLRNTFSYKQLSISANIFYKLDYVFRRNGLNYINLFFSNSGNSDFDQRWQKPGDENWTSVPSMIYLPNSDRESFYQYSDALIENGGFFRLQDITASYNFTKIKGLKNLQLYSNISNLGLIWKANKKGLDPDAVFGYPNPLTFAFGLTATF